MSTRRPERISLSGLDAHLPTRPPHLQGEARKEWSRLGRRLRDAGLLTDIDKTALAIYCQAWARWLEAEEQLAKYGTVIMTPSSFPVQSPYLAIANKAMEQMTRILVEFGMSPSSRSRVTPGPRPHKPLLEAAEQQSTLEGAGSDPRRFLRAL
jgi:P27 family predicted phage terminase small subunit